MSDSLIIEEVEYQMEGSALVAEVYLDGVEMWIMGVTSDLSHPCEAGFFVRGSRGGIHAILMSYSAQSLMRWRSRMSDAATHLSRVERFRLERWGVVES